MDSTNETLYFPARVRAVGDGDRRSRLTEVLRERIPDATVLESHAPFFFGGEISSTRLDAFYTHMLLSSLENYAREAAAGVAFLPGHNHNHLPIGSSLTGELVERDGVHVVRADFYTLPDLHIGEVDTNGLIVGIRGGLTRDMSIGFHKGRYICDICGQDYFHGRCPHLAGFTYEDEEDGVVCQQLATVGIDDAHLAEVSGVFDGATPGAMIDKIYELARSGELSIDDVRQAETVYRLDKATTARMLALPALQKRYPGGSQGIEIEQTGQQSGSASPEQMRNQTGKDSDMELDVGRVRETLTRAGIEDSGDLVADVAAMAERLDATNARVAALEPRAADGDQYRNDLVAEALAEGVRAYGEGFDSETYEEQLRTAPLKVIKRLRDDWQVVGDARFAGGRQTGEGDETPDGNGKPVELRAPAVMYR